MSAKIITIVLILVIPCYLFGQKPIKNTWVGGIKSDDQWIYVSLNFFLQSDTLYGTIDIPSQGILQHQVTSLRFDDSLYFRTILNGDTTIWKGRIRPDSIIGNVIRNSSSSIFHLLKLNPDSASELSIIGDYQLESGKYLSIFRMAQGGEPGELTYWNEENGRISTVATVGKNSFIIGFAIGEFFPIETSLRLVGDTLVLIANNRTQKAVRSHLYTTEDVTYSSENIMIAGELKTPNKARGLPAIVLVPGSGAGTREQVELIARFFVRIGYAVLSFDKRGCGKSEGDWRTIDFDNLSKDVIAGVKFLKTKSCIDTNRIGLWGISQGGYVAVQAAAWMPDVHFVISHSGPGVSPREQEKYMLNSIFEKYGLTKSDRDSILYTYDLMYDFRKSRLGTAMLDSAVFRLRKQPHLISFLPPTSDQLNFDSLYRAQPVGDPGWFLHLSTDFNPLKYYRQLKCPVLTIFGKNDYTLPVNVSAQNIKNALEQSGHKNFSVHILDLVGHGILLTDKNNSFAFERPHRVDNTYFKLIMEWLVMNNK